MVQTGVQRAYGPSLRRVLGRALGGRLRAFAAGLGITAVLQSSTATGLMAAAFAAQGLVELTPALAAMLGANVGTTLIVQVLSFDVSLVAPLLILCGVVMFRRGDASRMRDLGRVVIGLGLMLLSLRLLLDVVTPYANMPALGVLLRALSDVPLLDVALAAALTWAAHSSVAVVLLIMSLAAKGVVPPYAAFALVLGANLGTALNPVIEGSSADDPVARRVPIGNLLTRIAGIAIALAALGPISRGFAALEPNAAHAVADFHTAFNLAVAALFLPLLTPFAALLRRWLPARVPVADAARPIYLDGAAKEAPSLALSGAAREALRMADVLEAMLAGAQAALVEGDRKRIGDSRRMDDVLDRLNAAIKSYLTALDPDALTDADHRRLSQVLLFAMNLEQAGDVIDRDVLGAASRVQKRGLAFAPDEQERIRTLLNRLTTNLRTACGVFMAEDPRAARLLLAEKEVFRDAESAATTTHFARLRAGEGRDTGTALLDLLRDLKRVNAHFVAAAATPVLDAQGELLPTRLRPEE